MNDKLYGKASILAIGTELTTGQISNTNATWISTQLVNLAVEVVQHITVADDRARIRKALEDCAHESQLIFVTGGLGPTTDDFTRNVISEWLGKPLQYQEHVWQHIQNRLNRLGVPIAQSNQQQAYFPEGSEILANDQGTAPGFTSAVHGAHRNQQIWVFPGPPRELKTVWKQGVEQKISQLCPNLEPSRLFTWQCLGKSEAELGEITESALKGSDLLTGYRAHRPFVEVKVWCPESKLKEKSSWIQKLEDHIRPWILTRQGEDLAEKFLLKAQRFTTMDIFDNASGGILSQRLGLLFRAERFEEIAQGTTIASEWPPPRAMEEWANQVLADGDEETLTLALGGFTSEGAAIVGMKDENRIRIELIQLPYRTQELMDRMQPFIVEKALKQWCDWLEAGIT